MRNPTRDIQKRIDQFKEIPAKSGPGCAAALMLLAIICMALPKLTHYAENGKDNPLFTAGCLIVLVGGYFILYWICYFMNHLFQGVKGGTPVRKLISFDGMWFLRRKGVCFIMSSCLAIWMISVPVYRFIAVRFAAKSDLIYQGRRLTEEDASRFTAEANSLFDQVRGYLEGGKEFAFPKSSTEAGQKLAALVFTHYSRWLAATKKLESMADQDPLISNCLVSNAGVPRAQAWLTDAEALEKQIASAFYDYQVAVRKFLEDLGILVSLYYPKEKPSFEPVSLAYRKVFQFCKGKRRQLKNHRMVFLRKAEQTRYRSLLAQIGYERLRYETSLMFLMTDINIVERRSPLDSLHSTYPYQIEGL